MTVTWCANTHGGEPTYHDTEPQAKFAAKQMAAARPGVEFVWYPIDTNEEHNR